MFCKIGIHKWSRWEILKHGNIENESGVIIGYYITQHRYCKSCGKADIVSKNVR